MKELILKKRAEGNPIRKIAIAYDIDESTLGDWLYFWKHGIRRQSHIAKVERDKDKKLKMKERKLSPELKAMIRRNTEENDKKVKYISKKDNTIKTRKEYFEKKEE